jgi:hypothetical protein
MFTMCCVNAQVLCKCTMYHVDKYTMHYVNVPCIVQMYNVLCKCTMYYVNKYTMHSVNILWKCTMYYVNVQCVMLKNVQCIL